MAYESVDKLQNALGEEVFHYTQDKKKAAGGPCQKTKKVVWQAP